MKIRIGIVYEEPEVRISSHKGMTLISPGQDAVTVPPHHPIVVRVAHPPTSTYLVCTERPTQELPPGNWIQFRVGYVLRDGDREYDQRETWHCLEYAKREDAIQAQRKLGAQEIHSVLRRKIHPGGALEVWVNGKAYQFNSPLRVQSEDARLLFLDVPYGKGFHWERREQQEYEGEFQVYAYPHGVVVVNETEMEPYLMVVNSSEMHPDAPMEVLKAQTVAARATVLATIGKHHFGEPFDLCNTDHCQVYRGIQRIQDVSRKAVEETWGEVLVYGHEIVDARYAKTCGGVTEDKVYVWGGRPVPYLRPVVDHHTPHSFVPPLDQEERARAFIDARPPAYCDLPEQEVPYLGDILYRWEIQVSAKNLREIVQQKLGEDPGEILEIRPLKRGHSGRIYKLLLKGTKGEWVIFTELEIRRVLSKSHLPSSLFYVKREGDLWVFRGAGWGHGVGMCQVGSVGMARAGATYHQILAHYYPGTRCVRLQSPVVQREDLG